MATWNVYRWTKLPCAAPASRGYAELLGTVEAPDWGRAHEQAGRLHPDLAATSGKYPRGRLIVRPADGPQPPTRGGA